MEADYCSQQNKKDCSELDMGMQCFYRKTTGELESYPHDLRNPDFDEERWLEVIKKVKKNFDQYLCFEGIDSRESFKLLEAFVNEIEDRQVQSQFQAAIERKKPFQQFKYQLQNYPHLKQKWFTYNDRRIIEYVEQQLEAYNHCFDVE